MAEVTPVLDGEEESEELAARLSALRVASNDGGPVSDVVFGHLSVTIKVAVQRGRGGNACVFILDASFLRTAKPGRWRGCRV